MSYGELPSDLDKITETMGPPPPWYDSLQRLIPGSGYQFYGLGDREGEVEVNPREELEELKYNQEMDKDIPTEASRYTTVDPLSPMFRGSRAKYGYGEVARPGFGNFSTNQKFGFAIIALGVILATLRLTGRI